MTDIIKKAGPKKKERKLTNKRKLKIAKGAVKEYEKEKRKIEEYKKEFKILEKKFEDAWDDLECMIGVNVETKPEYYFSYQPETDSHNILCAISQSGCYELQLGIPLCYFGDDDAESSLEDVKRMINLGEMY